MFATPKSMCLMCFISWPVLQISHKIEGIIR